MPPPPTFDVRLARSRMLSPNVRELGFERVDGAPSTSRPASGSASSCRSPTAKAGARTRSPRRPTGRPGSRSRSPRSKVARLHLPPRAPRRRARSARSGRKASSRDRGARLSRRCSSARAPASRPLRSMILDALAAGDDSPLTLLFGVRHAEDRLYCDELEALARGTRTSASSTRSRARERLGTPHGYVQTHVEELWRELETKGSGAPHAYICGLERMVGAVRDRFASRWAWSGSRSTANATTRARGPSVPSSAGGLSAALAPLLRRLPDLHEELLDLRHQFVQRAP